MRRRRWAWSWAVVLGLAGVVVGLGGWGPSASVAASRGTPRLAADRTEIDLGTLAYGVRAEAVFTLRNAGEGDLKVLEVLPVKALKGC